MKSQVIKSNSRATRSRDRFPRDPELNLTSADCRKPGLHHLIRHLILPFVLQLQGNHALQTVQLLFANSNCGIQVDTKQAGLRGIARSDSGLRMQMAADRRLGWKIDPNQVALQWFTRAMTNADPSFWQAIYEAEPRPGWDLNRPSPLLSELLELAADLGLAVGPTVAVPGCGFGHDAAGLAGLGFQVTGLDFAPAAIEGARERYGDRVSWRLEDWFAPAESVFETIFDHTCFVAIEPSSRPRYITACADRLQPHGLWLGAFFHTVTGENCPPFPVAMEELRNLAEPWFEILHLGPAIQSHPKRAGREFLIVARKRAV